MAPVVIPAAIRTEILFDPLLLLPAKTKKYSEKAVQVRFRCLDCFEYVIYVLCHGFRSKKSRMQGGTDRALRGTARLLAH